MFPLQAVSEITYPSDAIIPAEFVPGVDNEDLGSHCFEYYRPEFRQRAVDGMRIM